MIRWERSRRRGRFARILFFAALLTVLLLAVTTVVLALRGGA